MKALFIVASLLLTFTAYGESTKPATAKQAMAKKSGAKKNSEAKKSLFDRLGGAPAITAVVDSFVNTTAANPKVNFFRDGKYKDIDVVHLKKQLTAFVTQATGGPGEYKGRDMKTTHSGMKVTADEFGAIAGDLAATLDKFKVPKAEKDELMTIAASTQNDIVETKK